jgi:hypothetical protein
MFELARFKVGLFSVTAVKGCVRKIAVHLQKLLEVMLTSVCTGLNPFNFIRKHFLQICVRKVAVHLHKVLEVMSTSDNTDNQIYVPKPKCAATFRTHIIYCQISLIAH